MDIKVDINAEDVNKAVITAIINSSFGSNLKDSIDTVIKKFGSSSYWDSALTKTIENNIYDIIRKNIVDNYSDKIKEQIAKHLTPDFISEIVRKSTDRIIKSMRDGY